MYQEKIDFEGRRDQIDELLHDLSSIEELIDVKLESVSNVNAGILERKPLNQHELAEIVIGITINVASSALYDLIRKKINERAKKEGFTRKYKGIAKEQRKIRSDQ